MAQKIIQTQAAVQTQQLAVMQVALAQMVELPLAQFAERVQTEMIDNEALEEQEDPMADDLSAAEGPEADFADGSAEDDSAPGDLGWEVGDYLTDDDMPDYLRERVERDDDAGEYVMAAQSSFYDDLQRQIGEQNLTEHEQQVLEYLIGSLDTDGFLRKDAETLADELAVYHNIMTTADEVNRLIAVLQTFEPRGIGARSLAECLRLQLTDPEYRSPWREDALAVIDRCFKDFTAKRWDLIMQRLGFDDDRAAHVKRELLRLNPAPGRAFGDESGQPAPTAVPDFYVLVGRDGTAEVRLNAGDVPQLRVSRAFRDSIRQYADHRERLSREQQDAYVYARRKVEAAQGFIQLVNRRRQTLLDVMQGIVDLQRPFFENDDDESLLRPMTLREVAARAAVDISTVSRTVGGKYVQTAYGLYPLKFFFSNQFTSTDGEELSGRRVRAALAELVGAEDKGAPLSDEALAARLKEQGLPVARRTVAKYREQMGIPVARFRRE